MTTLLVSQPNGEGHVTPMGHPERPQRLAAVADALAVPHFSPLLRREAVTGDLMLAELVHAPSYLARLRAARPAEGIGQIDADTFISAGSLDAATTALGAAMMALDAVVMGEVSNAFCAIRPPGHHAERDFAMGFCLVNTVAVAAREMQRKYGADRVAIVDFDVHHGNGTQDIFFDDASVFYGSSHQMPLFPGTGRRSETGVGNVFNTPLAPNTGGALMRQAYSEVILPALDAFHPDIILISAGFDAEERDPLAQLQWVGSDFAWLTGRIMDIADRRCAGRIVSLLEGGYDLGGLASGVTSHVAMLQDGSEAGLRHDERT